MNNTKQKIIYGAGITGEKAFNYYGGEQVYAFADTYKFGKEYLGKLILHPSELVSLGKEYEIIVCVESYNSVVEYLNSIGISEFRVNNAEYFEAIETQKAIEIQDSYNLLKLRNAEKLILFFIPNSLRIGGGLMSIFSLCEYSRKIQNYCLCLISTYPGKFTYAINEEFQNEEQIYRWEQIVNNGYCIKELILHIPEYYAKDFYKDLKSNEIEFLMSISNLHINIMNQNIELMPEPELLNDLYKLTMNITQTIAHHRSATQENCDKWKIPTHLFSGTLKLSQKYNRDIKQKIIMYSPDFNSYKSHILNELSKKLPDYKLAEISNMAFDEFQEVVSNSFITISFGEGFDGYFCIPALLGSLGMAVYNDTFFPDKSWLDFKNVYSDYEDMYKNIVDRILYFENNKEEYDLSSKIIKEKLDDLFKEETLINNLEKFYSKKYDYLPTLLR